MAKRNAERHPSRVVSEIVSEMEAHVDNLKRGNTTMMLLAAYLANGDGGAANGEAVGFIADAMEQSIDALQELRVELFSLTHDKNEVTTRLEALRA